MSTDFEGVSIDTVKVNSIEDVAARTIKGLTEDSHLYLIVGANRVVPLIPPASTFIIPINSLADLKIYETNQQRLYLSPHNNGGCFYPPTLLTAPPSPPFFLLLPSTQL